MATNTIILHTEADAAIRESAKGFVRAGQLTKEQAIMAYQLAVRVINGNAVITGMDIRGLSGEDCVKILFRTNSMVAASCVAHLVNKYNRIVSYIPGYND